MTDAKTHADATGTLDIERAAAGDADGAGAGGGLDREPVVTPIGGGVYRLTARQWLAAPRDQVFDFFSRAENLERITPASLGFRILTPTPIAMGAGTLIDYRIRMRGLPLKWRTRITAWEPGVMFEDSQERGPYARWVHRHTFADCDGGTLCGDQVDYRVPLGPIGRLVNRLFVAREVRGIFAHRRRVMGELFGTGTGGDGRR